MPGRPNDPDFERRLSRELEVGFRDESDDEEGKAEICLTR